MEGRGSTAGVKQKWEKELKLNISEEEWLIIWKTQHSSTSSRIWREHCWKNAIRFFVTPKTKSKHLSVAQPCWRKCGAVNVDHTHIFWLCIRITQFWENVYLIIKNVLGYDIPLTFKVMYLGVMTGDIVIREDRYLLKILLAACKKTITRRWYKTDPPTQEEWLKIVKEIYVMEHLTHCVKIQEEQFHEKWKKWTMFTLQRQGGH